LRQRISALIGILTIGTIGTLLVSGAGIAPAAEQADPSDAQPSIVEDYGYPGSAQILAQRGITLIRGDGHIMLVPCDGLGLIEVRSASAPADKDPDPGHYCFKVTGTTGSLTLDIPNAYQVKGDNHAVTATITVKDETSTVAVDKNGWTGIGLGSGPDPATLLKLDATT
jgi:hypothetical protein